MKAPESAIDVKMYEFGRLIDAVEETWCDCEMRNHDERSVPKYKQARERLEEAIRSAVDRGNLWGAAQANKTNQTPALPTGLALSSHNHNHEAK